MTATIRTAWVLSGLLLLAACGGGGSSGSAPAPTPPANRAPQAAFAATPDGGAPPLAVSLDASASRDPDGTIATYRWDFGDGNEGAGSTVSHRYESSGEFTISLTVTDDDGASATVTRTILVNAPPVASASADRQLGPAPLDVAFDGTGSTDADGEVVEYRWSFGDGASASGDTVTHRYTSAGRFEATLTVTDSAGATASTTVEVRTVFEASGTIAIQATSVADSDVNDEFSTPVRNDDFASAQLVPNPATIGGYVTAPGAGPDGVLRAGGDTRDLYRFEAFGGETLLLAIADANEDLDLRLFDATGTVLVDESIGVGETEVVQVPDAAPGTYFVAVDTFAADASSYVLTLGQLTLGATTHATRWTSAHAFVPGELVVGPAVTSAVRSASSAPDVPVKRLAAVGRESLLRIDGAYGSRWAERAGRNGDDTRAARLRTLSAAKDLHASGRYEWVEPNWIRSALATPDDPFLPSQWHYQAISLLQAWDLTQGDANVVVAVVDTGILPGHPEFTGQLVPGYDFVDDDADPTDPGSSEFGGASSFHGMHVAGTVAARTNNASGVAGVGWNTRVMPVRVLDGDGSGTAFDVRQGMRFAGGLDNASGTVPATPADVINLSLGGGPPSSEDQATIDALRARGIIVVAAAGNERTSAPSFPAAYEGVVSVSATDIGDDLAPYSNTGSTIDIAAPGGDSATDSNFDGIPDGVLSTLAADTDGNPSTPPAPTVAPLDGTSMAAPHVAGVAALMRAVRPGLTPEEFDALLVAGRLTRDLGAAGRDDRFGHGLLDARRAVLAALELEDAGALPGILAATPTTLDFGAFLETRSLELFDAGGAPVTVTALTPDQPWLSVAGVEVDASGLGRYEVRIDRAQLPETGSFTGRLAIAADTGNITVTVRVTQATADSLADAGRTFLIFVDPEAPPDTLFDADELLAENGIYTFERTDVLPGDYQIYAGSDFDNDGVICERAESCGIFPTIDDPTTITIGESDRPGLDFVISFRASFDVNSTSSSAAAPRRGFRIRKPQR